MKNKRNIKKDIYQTNNSISHNQVRLVGSNVENGIYSKHEAIRIAEDLGLDLILINENQLPPICRIEDYGKMVYEKKKKDKELQRKNREKQSEIKEIRLTPNTDSGDISHKLKKAEEFLKDGDKVKFTVKFKGRQIQRTDPVELILLEIAQELSDISTLEALPKMEGRNMTITLKPKKK